MRLRGDNTSKITPRGQKDDFIDMKHDQSSRRSSGGTEIAIKLTRAANIDPASLSKEALIKELFENEYNLTQMKDKPLTELEKKRMTEVANLLKKKGLSYSK